MLGFGYVYVLGKFFIFLLYGRANWLTLLLFKEYAWIRSCVWLKLLQCVLIYRSGYVHYILRSSAFAFYWLWVLPGARWQCWCISSKQHRTTIAWISCPQGCICQIFTGGQSFDWRLATIAGMEVAKLVPWNSLLNEITSVSIEA